MNTFTRLRHCELVCSVCVPLCTLKTRKWCHEPYKLSQIIFSNERSLFYYTREVMRVFPQWKPFTALIKWTNILHTGNNLLFRSTMSKSISDWSLRLLLLIWIRKYKMSFLVYQSNNNFCPMRKVLTEAAHKWRPPLRGMGIHVKEVGKSWARWIRNSGMAANELFPWCPKIHVMTTFRNVQ